MVRPDISNRGIRSSQSWRVAAWERRVITGELHFGRNKTRNLNPAPTTVPVYGYVGVDVSGNGKIDHWTGWQEVKETYDHKPGFARVVETAPASLDLGSLPAGFGFAFEYRTRAVDGQNVNVVMEQMELIFR